MTERQQNYEDIDKKCRQRVNGACVQAIILCCQPRCELHNGRAPISQYCSVTIVQSVQVESQSGQA